MGAYSRERLIGGGANSRIYRISYKSAKIDHVTINFRNLDAYMVAAVVPGR